MVHPIRAVNISERHMRLCRIVFRLCLTLIGIGGNNMRKASVFGENGCKYILHFAVKNIPFSSVHLQDQVCNICR